VKTLIHILGPGASGKSTLSRAILQYGNPVPYVAEVSDVVPCTNKGVIGTEKISYVWSSNGIALAGNSKSGTDSINAIDALPNVLELCWAKVPAVIVDPVRCSKKFVDWMKTYPEPLTALFVYLDLSLEENVRRLINRRFENNMRRSKGLAIPETSLPEKTYSNMLAFRERAQGVFTHAGNTYNRFPKLCLALPERLSTGEGAAAVHSALKYLEGLKEAKNDLIVNT